MVDYNFYKEVYNGIRVDNQSQFNRLARKASNLVNLHTFNRAKSVEDEETKELIKFTICELVDNCADIESVGNVTSESVGEHSVSYRNVKEINSSNYEIIYNNLIYTGLMYRGF